VLNLGDAVLPVTSLRSGDPAFVVDVAAAAAAAMAMGADPEGIAGAARSFTPAAHRRELVGVWGGVAWVDDSKATNPHAALAAIRSFPSVVLLAGGRSKGLDVGVLGAEPNLRFVVGLGEAGPEVVARAPRGTVASDMEEAVAIADSASRPGDTVLLAPGCASFDMYASYADRGDRFAESVKTRKGER
jgi:UDP-N-acetylmuramoylalanine--D-glutamate ligase